MLQRAGRYDQRIMLRNKANPGCEPNPAGTGGSKRQRRERIVYRYIGWRQKLATRTGGIWIMRIVMVEQNNVLRRQTVEKNLAVLRW